MVAAESLQSIICGIEHPTRCLCPAAGEENQVLFLLGTCSVDARNKVYLIEVVEEIAAIKKYTLLHDVGRVWSVSSSPHPEPQQVRVFSTCHRSSGGVDANEPRCVVWKYFPNDETQEWSAAELVSCDIGGCMNFRWNSVHRTSVLAHSTSSVFVCDLSDNSSAVEVVLVLGTDVWDNKLRGAKWSPRHGAHQLLVHGRNSVAAYDVRAKEKCWQFTGCDESSYVLDLDLNPNVDNYFATCGTDSCLRIWDERDLGEPQVCRKDNTHWVNTVRYNGVHDQLLITSSSDHKVSLVHIPSSPGVAFKKNAAPLTSADSSETCLSDRTLSEGSADRLVSQHGFHDDSVCSAEFSSANSWLYASLSYDGRVVVSHVPKLSRIDMLI